MKILVTIPEGRERESFFTAEAAASWERLGEVVYNPGKTQFTPEELHDALADADVAVTGWNCPKFTAEVIADAPKLRLLAHTGGTVAAVASPELYARGVKVSSGNRMFAQSVAEGVVAYMLAALRRLPLYSEALAKGAWMSLDYPSVMNEGLLGKTVGIVSFGCIAEYLARLLQSFGVRLLVYSRSLPRETLETYHMTLVSLDELFSKSDVITVQTALNPQTHNMIGDELLSKIKPGALFVNTARAGVVDEAALVRRVRAGQFRAAIDVYNEEPLPADSPWIGAPNSFLMPHMAGPTMDRRGIITAALAEEAERLEKGRPLMHEIAADKAFAMSDH